MLGNLNNTSRSFGNNDSNISVSSSEKVKNESSSNDSYYKTIQQQSMNCGYKSCGFFNNDNSNKREFFNNQSFNIRSNNQDSFSGKVWNHSPVTSVSPNNSSQRYIKNNSKNYNPRFDQNYDANSSDGDLIANVELNKTPNFHSNKAKLSPQLSDQATTITLQQQQQLAPISLREKRKNNEYESPLARISNMR